jgi:hypothetical protein
MNELLSFGRKILSFSKGEAFVTEICVTEKSLADENEQKFTQRLLGKYREHEGTIEIVIKNGRPDYAIIKFFNNNHNNKHS